MKLNLNVSLKGFSEEELKDQNGKVRTVASLCLDALLATYTNELIDGAEKIIRYNLALKLKEDAKIPKSGEINLTAEEITKIKELVGKMYPTLVVGLIYELLEK